MKTCSCDTAISRDGSGRLGRFLKALDPDYNPVDGRSVADLLVFVKRFASQIRFYKLSEDQCEEDGSWNAFFSKNVAVLAASVAALDLDEIEKEYLASRASFDQNRNLDLFKKLFIPITGIASLLDKWLSLVAPDFVLYQDIQLSIRSSMRDQILKVFELDKAAVLVNGDELGIDFDPENEDIWNLEVAIPFVGTYFDGATLEDKLFNASLAIDTIFNASFRVLSEIVDRSEKYLSLAIEKYPRHQPHIALFIAFLELFRLAQKQLNGLTEKHLNFYYRDVLRLREKAAQPDRVNVIFELAKEAAVYHLPKGTALSAGKDSLGIDQIYLTDRDMVINKAQVKEIKNVFIDQCGKGRIRGFYSQNIEEPADGWWNPFGADALRHQNSCGQIIKHKGSSYAQLGFAIASPQLRMEGGDRLVGLKMKGLSKVITRNEDFYIRMSGAKGWLDIKKVFVPGGEPIGLVNNDFFPEEPAYSINPGDPDMLLVYIPKKEQSVTGYDSKLHSDFPFPTRQPVMMILLQENVVSIASEDWENASLDFETTDSVEGDNIVKTPNFQLTTYVKDLRKVIVQNEQGVQPPDKPFYPFTAMPTRRSPLYIGSEELFNKPIDFFNVNLEWQDKELFNPLTYEAWVNKDWVGVNAAAENGKYKTLSVQPDRNEVASFKEWSSDLSKGFIKIYFEKEIETQPADVMRIGNMSKVNSVSLEYLSSLTKLDETVDEFFHVYPAGVVSLALDSDAIALRKEVSKLNLSFQKSTSTNKVWAYNRIFPDFKFGNQALSMAALNIEKMDGSDWDNIGNVGLGKKAFASIRETSFSGQSDELTLDNFSVKGPNQYNGAVRQEASMYIGLEGFVSPQNLSLLFQVAEGTAMNDDLDPPAINWSYLSKNEWKILPASNIILDSTYGLQTTGIVLFDIPADATNDNTILTTGLHWIAASVDEGSHRLPYLVKIVAQAVPALFSDERNAPEHYLAPLPASSISALVEKPVEIKTVQQPFASYNGVPAEIGKEFYMRVSERLRHKNRAVTVYDFEKLVLEYFPDIFKVKCITHTDPNCLCRDTSVETDDDCEARPVLKMTVNPNGAGNMIEGMVLSGSDESPLPGVTIHIKGSASGTASDANGKFTIAVPNEQAILTFSSVGYKTQEVSVRRSSTNSIVRLGRENKKSICCGPQVAPGHVLIVPIENLKNRNAVDILQPRTSYRVLREIENFIKKRTSPFVKVHTRNPVYEEVLTAFRVKFHTGLDKGFFLTKLNEDIRQFLTPWVYDAAVDVVFDGQIYASSVINFIEERPYVDFISDFMMYQVKCDCCGVDGVIKEVKETAGRAGEIADRLLKEQMKESAANTKVDPVEVAKIINAENHPAGFLTGDAGELWDFLRDESETMVEWVIRNVLSWYQISQDAALQTASNKYEQQLVMKVIAWYVTLIKNMGLKTLDDLARNFPIFRMVTLAEPTSARSILVSAGQHIIMLYEEEPAMDPCVKKKLIAADKP